MTEGCRCDACRKARERAASGLALKAAQDRVVEAACAFVDDCNLKRREELWQAVEALRKLDAPAPGGEEKS